jgi:hypothetical protein
MKDDRYPPPGTGESMTPRGEDIAKKSKEPGRVNEGVDPKTGRPYAGSSPEAKTGVNPEGSAPVDPKSPSIPPG